MKAYSELHTHILKKKNCNYIQIYKNIRTHNINGHALTHIHIQNIYAHIYTRKYMNSCIYVFTNYMYKYACINAYMNIYI